MSPALVDDDPLSIDELLRMRATTHPEAPIFGYPSSSGRYEFRNCEQLNRHAYRAAKVLEQTVPAVGPGQPRRAVAMLGLSSPDYIVTLLALCKLGHTAVLMSTRISTEAYVHLLTKTSCTDVVVQPQFQKSMRLVGEVVPNFHQIPFPTADVYDLDADKSGNMKQILLEGWKDPEAEAVQPSWVIHSSGSTGMPKPIYRSNEASVASAREYVPAERAICTLPLFHMYGLTTVLNALYQCTTIAFLDSSAPITGPAIMRAMQAVWPTTLYLVPYALKLLSETPGGVDELRKPQTVVYSGAACPKNLGNHLVAEGVKLVGTFGSTEVGALMSSYRPRSDKDWDYMKPTDAAAPYVEFVPQGDSDLYELVVLDGWPSKQSSNRADGAYCTNDLFERHPTDPNKWRCIARKDDTIILSNGENANPIPFELSVRTSPYVRECVVYGQGRPNLVMLVVPDESIPENISRADFVELIWSRVELANGRVPTYSRISKDAIGMLPKTAQYPATDKGTAIRQQFYKKFMPALESIYVDLQRDDNSSKAGHLALSADETREFIRKAVLDVLRPDDPNSIKDDDTDFFAAGLDSLQALELRRKIRALDTGGVRVGQNVAFEKPNIQALARYLYRLRVGGHDEQETSLSEVQKMERLIKKYSDFPAHVPGDVEVDGEYVVLTGATGSLGAQLVAALVRRPTMKKAYCLVRASSLENARERVMDSLKERMVYNDLTDDQLSKLDCLPSNLGRDDLGLSPQKYDDIVRHNTAVIHNSWAVNFNMDITSFEAQHIRGLHNLIKLCLASRHPSAPSLSFASSVSTCLNRKEPGAVPEELPRLEDAAMGYGGSKLVGEYICDTASHKTGMATRILRIGQLVGDNANGLWNAKEAIPLTVQSALAIKVLPEVKGDRMASWLPTDVAAQTMVELALDASIMPPSPSGSASSVSSAEDTPPMCHRRRYPTADDPITPSTRHKAAVFHVAMPGRVSWNKTFLPALAAAGLEFKRVPGPEWLRRLELEQDPGKNPAIKLLDFYRVQYGEKSTNKKNEGKKKGEKNEKESQDEAAMDFETERARRCSPTLREAKVVDSELVGKFLGYWREKWGV